MDRGEIAKRFRNGNRRIQRERIENLVQNGECFPTSTRLDTAPECGGPARYVLEQCETGDIAIVGDLDGRVSSPRRQRRWNGKWQAGGSQGAQKLVLKPKPLKVTHVSVPLQDAEVHSRLYEK
jgi:hypothetical protein